MKMSKWSLKDKTYVIHHCAEGGAYAYPVKGKKKEFRCGNCLEEFTEEDRVCLIVEFATEDFMFRENGLIFRKNWLFAHGEYYHLCILKDKEAGETKVTKTKIKCTTCGIMIKRQ